MFASKSRREAASNPSRSELVKPRNEEGVYARRAIGEDMGEDGSDGVKRVDVRAFDARESVRSNSEPRLDPVVREERESRRWRCGGSSQARQERAPVDVEKRESRRLCGAWSHMVKESDPDCAGGCCVPGSDAHRVKSGMVASPARQSPS